MAEDNVQPMTCKAKWNVTLREERSCMAPRGGLVQIFTITIDKITGCVQSQETRR